MSRLSQDVIELVRDRVDLVETVSRHVSLRRAGQKFKGLCPFHSEKTPSFQVDPERQLFYCFGCQTGGDVYTFVMRMENLEFYEAVQRLADEAGIPAEQVEPSPAALQRRRQWEILNEAAEAAADYYQRMLHNRIAHAARTYLDQRGVSAEAIRRFRIGYAPPGWRNVFDYLTAASVPKEVIFNAGLAAEGARGPYDRLRDRIIFPIADRRGRIVGFGGRSFRGDAVKYINSPESALYSKGEHLYALDALSGGGSGKRGAPIIVVEGYMDVVGLYDSGVERVVASLGTAFTPQQAKLLRRQSGHVVLAYDADKAGQTAALRGLDVLAAEGLDVRVARLPEGDDPDSYARRDGRDAFQRLIRDAAPLYEYKLDHALQGTDVSTVPGRVAAVKKIVPVLGAIDNAVAREGYVVKYAERLGVSAEALMEELTRHEAATGQKRAARHNLTAQRYTSTDPARRAPRPGSGRPKARAMEVQSSAARELLQWLLREPSRIPEARQVLGDNPFAHSNEKNLYRWLTHQGEWQVAGEALVGRIENSEMAHFAQVLLMRDKQPVGPFDVYLKRAQEEALKAQVENVEARLELLMRDEWIAKEEVDQLLVLLKGIRDRLERGLSHENAS